MMDCMKPVSDEVFLHIKHRDIAFMASWSISLHSPSLRLFLHSLVRDGTTFSFLVQYKLNAYSLTPSENYRYM